MQEDRRRKDTGRDIAPVNDLVEIIQFARVVERRENKAHQAEQQEVQRFRRVAAAEINKQSDREIRQADQILVIEAVIRSPLADDDCAR